MLKSKKVDDFRQRCSEVTLQSEAQGHFGNFVKMIEDANPNFRETFDEVMDSGCNHVLMLSLFFISLIRMKNGFTSAQC